MKTISIVLLVLFIIVSVLLILLVAIQDDGENGMGGLLGGRGTAAFGSHSASVLTKTTGVLVVLFFLLAFGLALTTKTSSGKKADISGDAETTAVEETTSSWVDNLEVVKNAPELPVAVEDVEDVPATETETETETEVAQ